MRSVTVWIFIVVLIAWTISESSAQDKKKEEEKKKKEEEKKKMEEEDEGKPKFIYRFVGFISEDDVKRSGLRGNPSPYSNPGGGNPYGTGYPMDYYG